VRRHTSHVTRHTSHVTRHTSHVTRHTSHVTRHTPLVTRHTSHVTRHTSHVTRRTSHATRHTSHVTRCGRPSPPSSAATPARKTRRQQDCTAANCYKSPHAVNAGLLAFVSDPSIQTLNPNHPILSARFHPVSMMSPLHQLVSPRIVVSQLLATLQHRNWRVRQEVILLITQVQ
jgi:hypothetical protein